MTYCEVKNLSKKTLASEQILRLFTQYFKKFFQLCNFPFTATFAFEDFSILIFFINIIYEIVYKKINLKQIYKRCTIKNCCDIIRYIENKKGRKANEEIKNYFYVCIYFICFIM